MKQNHSKISKPSQPNIDFLSSTEAIIAYSDDEEIIRHALISYAITEAITAGDQTALEPYKNVSLFSNISVCRHLKSKNPYKLFIEIMLLNLVRKIKRNSYKFKLTFLLI